VSELTRSRAAEILASFAGKPVLVVGDLMLDRFVWGDVSRISPEAPVPVVHVRRETAALGGAGNVAANLAALGASVSIAGILGGDDTGKRIAALFRECGVDASGVVTDAGRPSISKTRIVAHSQQVVRVDREDDGAVSAATAEALRTGARAKLGGAAALVISDYDKGAIGPALLGGLLADARRAGIPVVVDPKISHFSLYQPATILTPNQSEASRATGIAIRSDDGLERAGRAILDMLDTQAVLITRGEKGMSLFERDRPTRSIAAEAREVFDVTGAGDTVVACLTLALAAGAQAIEAAALANIAAGRAVSRLGTATVTPQEIQDELVRRSGSHS